MLITVDRNRAIHGKTSPNSICALHVFAPNGSRPQTPAFEDVIINSRATPFDRNTVAIREQDATSGAANGKIETVQACLSGADQGLHLLSRGDEFRLRQSSGQLKIGRIEIVLHSRAAPRCDNSRFCRLACLDGRTHNAGMSRDVSRQTCLP